MQKTFGRRVLTAVILALVLVAAVCLTAMAETVKYDFSSYPSGSAGKLNPDEPEKGGWSYTATITKGSMYLTNAEGTYGIGDQASKYGDLITDLCLTYTIPVENQVKIKDYSQIEFTRRMSNGESFSNTYGSTYSVTLVMDDGQTITKDYRWYDLSKKLNCHLSTVVDKDIQADIEALNGDPTLVKIEYRPYSSAEEYFNRPESHFYKPAVKDDPETEEDETVAGCNGSDYYFLTTYFQLTEAADMPTENLVGVIDSWDGTEADAHDGKITGLDAAKTYKYAPVHSLDEKFVTVSGKTEITDLVGGVYEVRAVEEGKADSISVIVVVPKVTQGSKNNVSAWNPTDAGEYIHTTDVISGMWSCGIGRPYHNTTTATEGKYMYLATGWDLATITGKSATASSMASAQYYRENYVVYQYAFTPEEQFDVDKVAIQSHQFVNSYYWRTNAPIAEGRAKYAMFVYTNGDTENPYVFVDTWLSTSAIRQAVVNASEQLDGYVTSIKYVHFYEIPDVEPDAGAASTGYPLYNGLKTIALAESTFAPSAAAAGVDSYKITGLDASKRYNFSTDGKTWTVVTGVAEIADLELGKYYIQESSYNSRTAASEVFVFDIKGAYEFVGAPEVNGTSIVGLDASAVYEYSVYTKLGASEWIALPTGSTEIANLENGLYAIRVAAGNGYFASTEEFVLVDDGTSVKTDIYYVNANGIKSVNTSGDMGNNLPFDIGYWSSDNYTVKDHNTSHGKTNYAAIRNSSFSLGFDDEAAFAKILGVNNTYTLKPDQIVEINDIKSMQIGHGFIGAYSDALLEGYSASKYTAKLRIFVADSDVEYYDIEHAWYENVIFSKYLPEDAHGYVTAFQFFPVSFIPEGAHVQDGYKDSNPEEKYSGDYIPGFTYLYGYELKATETIGEFVAEAYLDSYRIIGFEANKEYVYSTDKKNWTPVTEGASFIIVDEGTYYIKALGQNGNLDSVVVEIAINGKQPEASVSFADGKIVGFESGVAYEYRPVNYMDEAWVAIDEGTTALEVEAGVWAVRIAAGDGKAAGVPCYVVVASDKMGTIAWGKLDKVTKTFVQGYWTSDAGTIYIDNFKDNILDGNSTTVTRPRHAQFWDTSYEGRRGLVYRYAFNNDEVTPLGNFGSFSLSMGFGASNPITAEKCVALIRVHVEGGDVEYYDIKADHKMNWVTVEINPFDVIPAGASGFVTAIEIYPIWDIEGITNIVNAARYPVMRIFHYDADPSIEDRTSPDKWRCNFLVASAPDSLEVVKSETVDNYLVSYKIVGLDPAVQYEYIAPNAKGVPVALELGTTELDGVMPGVYKVRVAATETEASSAYVDVAVPFTNPVFGNTTTSPYTAAVGTEFATGKWINSYSGWDMTPEPTSPIYTVPLNTISYKYEFAEVDRFVVDEHPYFSIDFNNELLNMNNPQAFIKGAIAAIDIYVEGEDAPYTVTGAWKGHTKSGGYSPNKILVNLLDEYPEIAGKTVRAFDIRPYSNITSVPNDFNPEATAQRYLYFRLLYVGFFDSPANTGAIVFNTLTAVNTLTSIEASTNVIYSIGATPKTSDFEVYEVYSDGTKVQIKTFEIVAPENFAEIAGTDTITIKARGFEAEVEVAVGLDSIAIKTAPEKTAYFEGDTIDLSGIEIVAILANGEEVAINSGFEAAVNTASVGMTSVTVVFGGKEATFDITVEPVVLASIQMNNFPVKENEGGYTEGDEIDLTGLKILATYNNGKTEVVGLEELEWKYSSDKMVRGGVLTITYGGKTISGIILTVNSKAISELFIATPADKTVYMVGEEIDLTGLTVNVNYEDGTSAVVAEGFVATADLSAPGTQIVEVMYEGFTFSYEIEVIAIETAFIMEFPAKTEYLVGEELDTEGLTLYVLFSNGEELLLTEGFELIYDEFTAEGEYEVVLKYFGYEEPFVVTVVAEEEPEPEPVVVESITVTAPTKTEYTVGDTLDLAGMVVTANLSDGTTENVTAAATVDTTTLATAGNVTVTVTYEGFTATFVVTVAEKVVEPEEPANIAEGTIEGTTVNWVITTDGTLTVSGEGEVPNYTRSATAPWYAYAKQIKKIVVADGITKLGDYCFYNLSKATAIEISTTVKFLGVQFIRQTAITEVTLTSDVTITANAFGRADNLKTLNLSEDVKNLQGNIFYQETVTIKAPENSFAHKYAEIYASKFASSAATVAYESDGTTAKLPIVRFAAAGDNAFFAIYENAKGNWALEVSGIGVMKNFPYVSAKNIAKGFTFSPMYYIGDEEAKIDGVEPEAKIASITVKEGITTVGNYIFYKCTKATTLTLPEGITSIGQGAFRLCQRIAKITLPEAVTKIEKNAFLSCGKLVEIYIPEGVTTVGEGIFEKCDSINSLVVKTKSAAAIEVISAEYPMVTIVTEF